jgi:hypothetical protein
MVLHTERKEDPKFKLEIVKVEGYDFPSACDGHTSEGLLFLSEPGSDMPDVS